MRLPVIMLLATGLALSPVRGRAEPEVSPEVLDALLVLAASPEVDTARLMGIVLDMFPGRDIHQILDMLLADSTAAYAEVPAYAGPTGFEDKPGPAFDLTDPTAPGFEVTVMMAVLAEAARRIAILDDSDRLVEVYRAAGGIRLPRPFRWSALGMRWHAAVEARDYEAMAAIARQIRERQDRFPRTPAQGLR